MWSCGRAARQRSAKPRTAVRIRSGPPKSLTNSEAFLFPPCLTKNLISFSPTKAHSHISLPNYLNVIIKTNQNG